MSSDALGTVYTLIDNLNYAKNSAAAAFSYVEDSISRWIVSSDNIVHEQYAKILGNQQGFEIDSKNKVESTVRFLSFARYLPLVGFVFAVMNRSEHNEALARIDRVACGAMGEPKPLSEEHKQCLRVFKKANLGNTSLFRFRTAATFALLAFNICPVAGSVAVAAMACDLITNSYFEKQAENFAQNLTEGTTSNVNLRDPRRDAVTDKP